MLGGTPVTEINRLSAREMLQEISAWKKAAHDTQHAGQSGKETASLPLPEASTV
jgi:hypothetical protein